MRTVGDMEKFLNTFIRGTETYSADEIDKKVDQTVVQTCIDRCDLGER